LAGYLSAAGALGLALYDVSKGDFNGAYASFLVALGVFGVHHTLQSK
jgi:hypothetical protein